MREVSGDLWSFYGRETYIVLITTNGSIRKNGKGVMGRGCAAEARLKIPGIERLLGANLQTFGNVLALTDGGYGFFPVKHEWWQDADMELIVKSATQLEKLAQHEDFTGKTFILPRPGCGSGGLQWSQVKPLLIECKLQDNVWVINKSPF